MVTYTKDYYKELKADIDPKLSRSENFGKLKMASAKYSQMAHMDVKLALVDEALDIFGNEEKYRVYRIDYITLALKTFIWGAKENDKISIYKYNELREIAWKDFGISEKEVKDLIDSLTIKIYKPRKPPPEEKEIDEDQKNREKKINEDKINRERKINEDRKIRERKKRKIIIATIISVFLILVTLIFIIPNLKKQSANKDRLDIAKTTINLTDALNYIDIKPPEFSKIEEAVKSFNENIDQPGAKEGLIKATDIYEKWGDDAPSIGERQTMYQKALECSSAAKGSKTEEIKAKLEELTLKE